MSREEIRDALKAKGLLEGSGSRDSLWQQAFDLYNKQNNKSLHIGGCGSCYTTVRAWLKR